MASRLLPFRDDPIQPSEPTPVTITVDGDQLSGVAGQSIAGVILANERLSFRRTSVHDKPRGVFCGIGVCFDCLVVVDGIEDVRACQRRARDGDVVTTQHHGLPGGDS
ncbi:MAG TPA: (2Fe-2S)-binding protein [Homoserinimonas sp.]|nr:(2Fe-2S)-binding protein [Homoserinimonas sp.]